MNLLSLIQQNQDILEEPTYDRFTKEEHIRWLNRAIEDIAIKTKYFTTTSNVNTEDGVAQITLPANAVFLTEVYYNNAPLSKVTRRYLDENVSSWETATGAPTAWFVDKNNTFTLYPIPDDVYAIVEHFVATDDVLSDDADVPNFPSVYHMALCYFACGEMLVNDEQFKKSSHCAAMYREKLGEVYKAKSKYNNVKVPGLVKPSIWSS